MFHNWVDNQYMKTYHPSTSTGSSFQLSQQHINTLGGAAAGAVSGVIGAIPQCNVNPICYVPHAINGAVIGASSTLVTSCTTDMLKK